MLDASDFRSYWMGLWMYSLQLSMPRPVTCASRDIRSAESLSSQLTCRLSLHHLLNHVLSCFLSCFVFFRFETGIYKDCCHYPNCRQCRYNDDCRYPYSHSPLSLHLTMRTQCEDCSSTCTNKHNPTNNSTLHFL